MAETNLPQPANDFANTWWEQEENISSETHENEPTSQHNYSEVPDLQTQEGPLGQQFPGLETISEYTNEQDGSLFVGWRDAMFGPVVYAKLENTGVVDDVAWFSLDTSHRKYSSSLVTTYLKVNKQVVDLQNLFLSPELFPQHWNLEGMAGLEKKMLVLKLLLFQRDNAHQPISSEAYEKEPPPQSDYYEDAFNLQSQAASSSQHQFPSLEILHKYTTKTKKSLAVGWCNCTDGSRITVNASFGKTNVRFYNKGSLDRK